MWGLHQNPIYLALKMSDGQNFRCETFGGGGMLAEQNFGCEISGWNVGGEEIRM